MLWVIITVTFPTPSVTYLLKKLSMVILIYTATTNPLISLSLSLSLSHIMHAHTHAHTHMHTRAHACAHTHTLSLSLSLLFFFPSRSALEVTGYESPIVVGLRGTLRCSTILNITSVKWYLAATENVLESSSSSIVEYNLTPNSAGLDGTRFTCKAETVNGEIYSKTITIQVKGVSYSSM